uniref:Uncharacterized protein n=1 Tax=Timema shepardi TaxID=629360 RepID=A0A7R9AUC7_TIMSH|nr:unnamed protein product [Timema shepardi]
MSLVPHTIHGGDPLYTNARLADTPADAPTCSLVTLAHTLDTPLRVWNPPFLELKGQNKKDPEVSRSSPSPVGPQSSEMAAAYPLDKEGDRENKERSQESQLGKWDYDSVKLLIETLLTVSGENDVEKLRKPIPSTVWDKFFRIVYAVIALVAILKLKKAMFCFIEISALERETETQPAT